MADLKPTGGTRWRWRRRGARPPRPSRVGTTAAAVVGVGPDGEVVQIAVGGGEVVLAFLSSSCQGCRQFWTGLGDRPPVGPRLAIVTPGPQLEDRRKVAALAPPAVPVAMSAEAWADFDVTRSPFAVVVRDGRITAEGPLLGWDDLTRLLGR